MRLLFSQSYDRHDKMATISARWWISLLVVSLCRNGKKIEELVMAVHPMGEWWKLCKCEKKLFFNCANPAKLIGIRLNLEVTIKWKYLPFCVRKNSSANFNVPPYSLLCWFTNLADNQPSRVKGQLCMAKKRAFSVLLVLGGISTANFNKQAGSPPKISLISIERLALLTFATNMREVTASSQH